MVWVKKQTSPDYVNGLARARIAVNGTADDWVLPWLNLVPLGEVLDVNAFCAAGPPPAAVFTIDDFIPAIGTGGLGAVGALWLARDKLKARVYELLFASLCELSTAGGTHCNILENDWLMPTGQSWTPRALPTGSPTSLKLTCTALSTNGIHDLHVYWWSNVGALTETFAPAPLMTAVGQVQTHTIPANTASLQISTNGVGQRVKIEYCGFAGTLAPYVPAAAPAPASALLPPPKVYTTIADLGAELDELENKVHWLLDYAFASNVEQMHDVLIPDETIAVEDPDADVALGPDVMGFIVTLSAIPGSADERFGAPLQLHNLGRVVMGNGTAWLPPIPLTVSPMLLLKPDPSITVCRVHTWPPTTASILTLVKPPLP